MIIYITHTCKLALINVLNYSNFKLQLACSCAIISYMGNTWAVLILQDVLPPFLTYEDIVLSLGSIKYIAPKMNVVIIVSLVWICCRSMIIGQTVTKIY